MKRELIVKVLKEAKTLYESGDSTGMCASINIALFNNGFVHVNNIQECIPKYDRKFLNAPNNNCYLWWWPKDDRESRIKAFDKLIGYYSQPTLSEKIINKIKQYGRKCIFWK